MDARVTARVGQDDTIHLILVSEKCPQIPHQIPHLCVAERGAP